jgi:hypothetical protein
MIDLKPGRSTTIFRRSVPVADMDLPCIGRRHYLALAHVWTLVHIQNLFMRARKVLSQIYEIEDEMDAHSAWSLAGKYYSLTLTLLKNIHNKGC